MKAPEEAPRPMSTREIAKALHTDHRRIKITICQGLKSFHQGALKETNGDRRKAALMLAYLILKSAPRELREPQTLSQDQESSSLGWILKLLKEDLHPEDEPILRAIFTPSERTPFLEETRRSPPREPEF